MEKLALTDDGKVICSLSGNEFKGLAKQMPGQVPDGTSVSLAWLQSLIQRLTTARLDAIIAKCDELKAAAVDAKGP